MKRRSKKSVQSNRKASRNTPAKKAKSPSVTGKIFTIQSEGLPALEVNPHRWGEPQAAAPLPHWIIDDPIIL